MKQLPQKLPNHSLKSNKGQNDIRFIFANKSIEEIERVATP